MSERGEDLSKGYYKMSQAKIITVIGCTISACLTAFGFYNSLPDTIQKLNEKISNQKVQIENLQIQVQDCKDEERSIWQEIGNLQNEINQKR